MKLDKEDKEAEDTIVNSLIAAGEFVTTIKALDYIGLTFQIKTIPLLTASSLLSREDNTREIRSGNCKQFLSLTLALLSLT